MILLQYDAVSKGVKSIIVTGILHKGCYGFFLPTDVSALSTTVYA